MKIPDQQHRFKDREEWRAWLAMNHAEAAQAWVIINKKHAPLSGINLEEATEEAVCFGWIDSVMKSLDADTYALRFTPRRANSIWSMTNRERVGRLIEQGKMTEAGMATVREAQKNGQWDDTLRRESAAEIPPDLVQALTENPDARARFEALAPSHKKQYIYWIISARTPPTRQRRVEQTIEMVLNKKRLS